MVLFISYDENAMFFFSLVSSKIYSFGFQGQSRSTAKNKMKMVNNYNFFKFTIINYASVVIYDPS
jgi:hypothetical protein